MPKDILPKLTRRDLLKLSAAAGVAASVPWASGCDSGSSGGGGSTPPPPESGREMRSLHLDLSSYDPNARYFLNVIGSKQNLAALRLHTVETRQALRAESPHLDDVDDGRLTHFASAVDLPAARVQHIWVSREEHDGTNTVVLTSIYVPTYFLVQAAHLTAAGMVGGKPGPLADLDALRSEHLHMSSRDTAISIVYHHPQMMRLDPMQAAIVKQLIGTMDEQLEILAETIDAQGDTWVDKYPATDAQGRPVTDPWSGQPIIQQDPSDEVMEVADQVISDALKIINDELSLEGANWHTSTGRTKQMQPSLAGRDPSTVLAELENDAFRAVPAQPKGATMHGVLVDDFSFDSASRTVHMPVRNTWLRYVGVYVEFRNPVGQLVKGYGDGAAPKNAYAQLDVPLGVPESATYTRCLNVAPTNTDYLGIPFRAQDIVPTALNVQFPNGASNAKVIFGTLGIGNPVAEEAILGTTATFIMNIGIPGIMLATTIGSTSVSTFAEIFKNPILLTRMVTLVPLSVFESVRLSDIRPLLYQLGKVLVDIALKGLPILAAKLAEVLGIGAVQQAVPFVGWAVKAARISASIAELAQTIAEVTSSPSRFENEINLVMNIKVTIKHDPKNFQFPATAKKYIVKLIYVGSVAKEIEGTLTGTRSEPIIEVFTDAPAGGRATIDVIFLSETGWVAGRGTTGEFDSTPAQGSEKEITITENLVPLNAQTVYSHKQKVVIDNNQHVWREGTAPTKTRHDLNCDDDSLCDLGGITVSQGAAMAGYSWQSRGQVTVCGGQPTTAAAHRIQNISIAQSPESALKAGACGYLGKPLLTYELQAAQGASIPRSFYLDPTNGGYHLRSVTLDQTTAIDQVGHLSWGAFSQPIDSLAVHPSGYVVGVNTQNHRLEIVTLRTQAAADDTVSFAALKGGRGTRVGLLDTPIAVGIDHNSLGIFVLEAGSTRRIQAFDCYGNQLLAFDKKGSATTPLKAETAAVQYLDMAVESTGYIYVLSYQNSGTAVSDYRVDIYDPDGKFVSRTTGVAAARVAVDAWRNLFTLNYEALRGPRGLEPSVSEWIPSTPRACAANDLLCQRTDIYDE